MNEADSRDSVADLVIGDDGLARPPWAAANQLLRDYYDNEWGMPIYTEQGLFERLSLEAFQSGLSWSTILQKRPAFRAAFHDFDPDVVAEMDEGDVVKLLGNADIVRNQRKIEATIRNARAVLRLREEGPGLSDLLWSFKPDETPAPRTLAELPTTSPESVAMAKELKRHGFSFVGPTTCYALMSAVGMVDIHLVGEWRRGCSGLWD